MYKFIIFSSLLHASVSTSMYFLDTGAPSDDEQTISFEFQQPMEKQSRQPSKKINKSDFIRQAHSDPLATHEEKQTESEASPQRVVLQGSVTHPYFKKLWQILKKKKQNIQHHSQSTESYFILFSLKKSGMMENIKVSGFSAEVSEVIEQTLNESAELPPVPDEVSSGDLLIQYQVDI